jgi:hypothetical protein
MLVICPRHEGGYDCNPFCDICEGEQEVELREPEAIEHEFGRPVLALKITSVYRIIDHLSRDNGLTRNMTDELTEALRELQIELLQIAVKRES